MNNPAKYYNPKLIPPGGVCWFLLFCSWMNRGVFECSAALRWWQWKSSDIFFCDFFSSLYKEVQVVDGKANISHLRPPKNSISCESWADGVGGFKETGLWCFGVETAQREACGLMVSGQDKAQFLYLSGFSTEYISRPHTPRGCWDISGSISVIRLLLQGRDLYSVLSIVSGSNNQKASPSEAVHDNIWRIYLSMSVSKGWSSVFKLILLILMVLSLLSWFLMSNRWFKIVIIKWLFFFFPHTFSCVRLVTGCGVSSCSLLM